MLRIAIVGNLAGVGKRLADAINDHTIHEATLFETHASWVRVREIRKLLRGFDVIHALTLSPVYVHDKRGFYSCHATGSDLRELVTSRPEAVGKNKWTYKIIDYLLLKAYKKCQVLFIATPELSLFANKLGIPEDKVVYLPNIVEKPPKVGIEKDDKVFRVFVPSRWDVKAKGTDKFLRAFGQFIQGKKDVELVMIQDELSGDKTQLLELLEPFKGKVRLLERLNRNDLFIQYAKANIIFDQCTVGALGLCSLEAMSIGKPVIVNWNEQLDHHYNGDTPPVINCKSEDDILKALEAFYEAKHIQHNEQAVKDWLERNHSSQEVASLFCQHLPSEPSDPYIASLGGPE